MAKPISPMPPADTAWLQHFQAVSAEVKQLRQQHHPKNPQSFTNRVWAKHLLKVMNGGLK
jgi:hypothetical protein